MKEFEDSKSSDRSVQLYKKTYQQLADEFEEYKDCAITIQRELIEKEELAIERFRQVNDRDK